MPTLHLDERYGYDLILEANDATWQAIAERLETAIESAELDARN